MDRPEPSPTAGATAEPRAPGQAEPQSSPVQAQDPTVTILKPRGHRVQSKSQSIQTCDFRQPSFLAPGELRKLRVRHEEFIRSLSARLSIYLRLDVRVQLAKLQTVSYQQLTETLPEPTHLTLFKAEPLNGMCLLEIPPRLGLAIVDRLLGGPAQTGEANRELSEIETALLEQVVLMVLNEWCTLWKKPHELRPTVVGHENNSRFLHLVPNDTVMLVLTMDVQVGDGHDAVRLAFPCYTLEPIVRLLQETGGRVAESQARAHVQPGWSSQFNEIQVRLLAQWPQLEMSVRQLTALKVGDVLVLDRDRFNQVQVCIGPVPKFVARLGACGDFRAVQLSDPLKP